MNGGYYDSDSGMNLLPGDPITITVTRVVQPATTTTVLSYISSQSVPATLPNGSPPPPHTTTWTTTSYAQAPSTTLSTLVQSSTASLPRTSTVSVGTGDLESGDSNQGLEPVSGSSAPKKVPSGVLIGVILACILVAFGVAVYVIRTRYVRRRQRLRKGWTSSKASHLSVAPEPKVSFSSSSPHAQQVAMLVKPKSERSPLTLDITETMPLAPPNSYGNESQSPVSATLTSSQSPVYGPPATKALGQPITTVVSTFITTLPDELAITVGESIRVLAEYDDGWALCLNSRGEQGMIPMECLDGRYSIVAESISGNRGAGGNLRRVSSLQPGSVGSVGRF